MAYEIVQTAEIIEKNGLSFQDFWRYTYLHNKNILEYVEIAVTDSNSWIPDIEGHSNMVSALIYQPYVD